tara:strand:- start:9967 stop:10743 length:777 start_codon:yes stop_codon:yes gene_type:complete
MDIKNAFWKSLVLASFGLSATSLYVVTRPDPQPQVQQVQQPALTERDVVLTVDARIKELERRRAKSGLDALKSQYALAPVSGTDKRLYGNVGSRVTLREFSDLECPWCKKMHQDLKKVVDGSQGVINWEFMHYPLGRHNPVAANEAMAVECVANQYDNRTAWAFMDKVFDQTLSNGRGADIPKLAQSLGLNGTRLQNCITTAPHREVIHQNFSSGKQKGVTATPAIELVDNQTGRTAMIKGYKTPEQLLQAIQSFLSS